MWREIQAWRWHRKWDGHEAPKHPVAVGVVECVLILTCTAGFFFWLASLDIPDRTGFHAVEEVTDFVEPVLL